MLRIVDPRVRRHLSDEEEEEAAPAPAMLSVEGDAVGMRWPRELNGRRRRNCVTSHMDWCARLHLIFIFLYSTLDIEVWSAYSQTAGKTNTFLCILAIHPHKNKFRISHD